MNRPRRAASTKPVGHYAPTSQKRKASATGGGPARKKGKKAAQPQVDGIGLPIPVIQPTPLDPAALALDLNKSYESEILPPTRPKRQTRWQQPASNPIMKLQHTPKGWNDQEPDLDPDDLKAQIARCHERISDNIMTRTFEYRLRELLREQQSRAAMMALEPAGLSWPVVQRLDTLQGTLEWLQKGNDEYKLVANVTKIMAAYRAGQLRWIPGLVTYWSRGAQLCNPRPFRWDEFNIINAQYDGHTGFWVEGLDGPGPGSQRAEWVSTPYPGKYECATFMNICVQIPDSTIVPKGAFNPAVGQASMPNSLVFVDDTGADAMQINKSDMRDLININRDPNGIDPPLPPLIGALPMMMANGAIDHMICRQFEVNMYDTVNQDFLTLFWYPVQVIVYDDTFTKARDRLNGPWPRHRLYSASAPDGSSYTYFGDVHSSLLSVPYVDPAQIPAKLPDLQLQSIPIAKTAGGKAAGGKAAGGKAAGGKAAGGKAAGGKAAGGKAAGGKAAGGKAAGGKAVP
ncbi:hypothetical protein ACN42_g10127 [Penicillium freii]|uniref:Uncharacterized protein n=1 Tax=Penicillium freii TaxID=48697 RepID=A0A117NL32_PENFR|nr:hypothetical protein ACN42_g10127 [Penicillium freii]